MRSDYTTKYTVTSKAAAYIVARFQTFDRADPEVEQFFSLPVCRCVNREERFIAAEDIRIFFRQLAPKRFQIADISVGSEFDGNIGAVRIGKPRTETKIAAGRSGSAAGIFIIVADMLHFRIIKSVIGPRALVIDIYITATAIAVTRHDNFTLSDLNIILAGHSTAGSPAAVKLAVTAAAAGDLSVPSLLPRHCGRNVA